MESIFTISNSRLSLRDLDQVLRSNINLSLSENSRKQIVKCREYLDQKLAASSTPIYGINTGFGSLYNKNIPKINSKNFRKI
jgi:histidine ammonia-lyase